MNAKIAVFVICVEAIIYLLLNNLRECIFNPFHVTVSFYTPGKPHVLRGIERDRWHDMS